MILDTPQVPTPNTPPHNSSLFQSTDTTPPSSQSPGGVSLSSSTMPTVAASSSGANANGKRPLDTLDGTIDAASGIDADSPTNSTAIANGTKATGTSGNQKVHTHASSGYTWTRAEDGPGYAWINRKAQEDANRAWETGIVGKDRVIQSMLLVHFSLGHCFLPFLCRSALLTPEQTATATHSTSRIEKRP